MRAGWALGLAIAGLRWNPSRSSWRVGELRGAGAARDRAAAGQRHPDPRTQPTALGRAVSDLEGPGLPRGEADRVAAPGFSPGCQCEDGALGGGFGGKAPAPRLGEH